MYIINAGIYVYVYRCVYSWRCAMSPSPICRSTVNRQRNKDLIMRNETKNWFVPSDFFEDSRVTWFALLSFGVRVRANPKNLQVIFSNALMISGRIAWWIWDLVCGYTLVHTYTWIWIVYTYVAIKCVGHTYVYACLRVCTYFRVRSRWVHACRRGCVCVCGGACARDARKCLNSGKPKLN